jgi:hypothetical protein
MAHLMFNNTQSMFHASHYSTEQGCTMTSDGQKQPLLAFSQELEGKRAIYAFHNTTTDMKINFV